MVALRLSALKDLPDVALVAGMTKICCSNRFTCAKGMTEQDKQKKILFHVEYAEPCTHVGAILHWVETAVRICNDTPCTSVDNKWLMPAPAQDIPCLQLTDIDFSALNIRQLCHHPHSLLPLLC